MQSACRPLPTSPQNETPCLARSMGSLLVGSVVAVRVLLAVTRLVVTPTAEVASAFLGLEGLQDLL